MNTDNYGLIPGLAQSANDLITSNLSRYQEGSCVKWRFFVPSNSGFKFIDDLVLKGKVSVYIFITQLIQIFKQSNILLLVLNCDD